MEKGKRVSSNIEDRRPQNGGTTIGQTIHNNTSAVRTSILELLGVLPTEPIRGFGGMNLDMDQAAAVISEQERLTSMLQNMTSAIPQRPLPDEARIKRIAKTKRIPRK